MKLNTVMIDRPAGLHNTIIRQLYFSKEKNQDDKEICFLNIFFIDKNSNKIIIKEPTFSEYGKNLYKYLLKKYNVQDELTEEIGSQKIFMKTSKYKYSSLLCFSSDIERMEEEQHKYHACYIPIDIDTNKNFENLNIKEEFFTEDKFFENNGRQIFYKKTKIIIPKKYNICQKNYSKPLEPVDIPSLYNIPKLNNQLRSKIRT